MYLANLVRLHVEVADSVPCYDHHLPGREVSGGVVLTNLNTKQLDNVDDDYDDAHYSLKIQNLAIKQVFSI